jgi:hypothetical protein
MTWLALPRSRNLLTGLLAALVLAIIPSASAEQTHEDEKEYEADKGSDKISVSNYEASIQQRYKLFSAKCSKCHTLARPINTNKTDEQWMRYVKRMMNKPKANISPDQGKQIYLFLKFFQAEKNAGRAGS